MCNDYAVCGKPMHVPPPQCLNRLSANCTSHYQHHMQLEGNCSSSLLQHWFPHRHIHLIGKTGLQKILHWIDIKPVAVSSGWKPLRCYYRAVAASQVSPVSTGPLFPSLMACLVSPISAIAWQTPIQGPHAHSTRWEVTC